MTKIFIAIIFLGYIAIAFSQTNNLDKIELKNGKILLGKVEIVKVDVVEFIEKETGIKYEFEKSQISYIALANGKILTFENKSATQTTSNSQNSFNETTTYHLKVEKKNLMYLGGGISFPLSPENFKKYWDMGYNLGGAFYIGLNPTFSMGIDFSYSSLNFNGEKLFQDAGYGAYNFKISGGEASILSFLLNLKISVSTESVQPYFLLGIGYFNLENNDATVSLTGAGSQTVKGSSEGGFNYNLGIGFDISLSPNLFWFMEGKFQSCKTKNESTNFLPLKTGIAILL